MSSQILQAIGSGRAASPSNAELKQAKLKKACAGFESLFLTYLLKSMRSAVTESGLLGNRHEDNMMKSMLDEKIAVQVADSGGIGLGQALLDSINKESY